MLGSSAGKWWRRAHWSGLPILPVVGIAANISSVSWNAIEQIGVVLAADDE
jgi:hypothetical protein